MVCTLFDFIDNDKLTVIKGVYYVASFWKYVYPQGFLKPKKCDIPQWPSLSLDLNPKEHAFHLPNKKVKAEEHKQAVAEGKSSI